MAPAARINWLVAVHCALAWLSGGAAAIVEYPKKDFFFGASAVLFCSHAMVSGLVVGLLLSDTPGPIQHGQRRPLTLLSIGLPSLWVPVAFAFVRDGELIGLLIGGLYGLCVVIGLFAMTVAISLAAFNLCLVDEWAIEQSRRKFQFSLRQLIALTTLVALACGLPKLAAASTGFVGDLVGALSMLFGIVMAVVAMWLVAIGIPLGTILLLGRPWFSAAFGLLAAEAIVVVACYLLRAPRWQYAMPELMTFVGACSIVVMASLGVLRSCGLRLVPQSRLAGASQRIDTVEISPRQDW